MTHHVTRVHTFWCDEAGCNESFEEAGSTAEAWAHAADEGWRMRGGKHYCPRHAERTER